ncbi:MAG: hydrogenase expression/formation protein [Gammaproteobacteria bacterium]|nr:hydrogenase expression/formation protein [Gammaproteobacteria bacterium]
MNSSKLAIEIPLEIAEPTTGMVQAVLRELLEHVELLAESGQQHVIDLTSLPLNDSDKRELENVLGKGEISVTLSTLGDSRIIETGINGIWWIKHFSPNEKLLAELIEITPFPEIIKSHPDDIKQAVFELKKLIEINESGEEV